MVSHCPWGEVTAAGTTKGRVSRLEDDGKDGCWHTRQDKGDRTLRFRGHSLERPGELPRPVHLLRGGHGGNSLVHRRLLQSLEHAREGAVTPTSHMRWLKLQEFSKWRQFLSHWQRKYGSQETTEAKK